MGALGKIALFISNLSISNISLSRTSLSNGYKRSDETFYCFLSSENYKISFHEFAEAFIAKKREHVSGDRLRRVFQEADRDRDGYLTTDECFAALKQLGHVMDDKGIRRVMGLMDKNNDGMVTFQGNIFSFMFSNER